MQLKNSKVIFYYLYITINRIRDCYKALGAKNRSIKEKNSNALKNYRYYI